MAINGVNKWWLTPFITIYHGRNSQLVFIKVLEMLADTLNLKLEVEEIKQKLKNQDKSIELVFTYLDELLEKQRKPEPRKQIGYKLSQKA